MTAPALSPAEQAEAVRFGVHDEEILRDIAEHANDVIPCQFDGAPAVWRLANRCCGHAAFFCQSCRDRVVEDIPKRSRACNGCDRTWRAGSAYPDIIREVQL